MPTISLAFQGYKIQMIKIMKFFAGFIVFILPLIVSASSSNGQILIVLDGEGYHQIEGQPKQIMRKGDVIKPPKVKHWHGATENNSLTQMYILPKTDNGIVTWLEPVTEEQYNSCAADRGSGS